MERALQLWRYLGIKLFFSLVIELDQAVALLWTGIKIDSRSGRLCHGGVKLLKEGLLS